MESDVEDRGVDDRLRRRSKQEQRPGADDDEHEHADGEAEGVVRESTEPAFRPAPLLLHGGVN
jgi:hypothetical protein